ncbi:MAG: D-alanyl-D-alanine carboxypeptidase family protein [Deltaproteobacteria bacterium]|nr:D-alanyl-D-alanine carboxypeptidase family protein [Deltaproteobacteria bacterium]
MKVQLVIVDYREVEIRTARAFRAMQRAALEDNIELMIYSGFRTHERQTWLYRAWRAGVGNRAARPGFSNHQSGRALDLVVHDPETLAWLDRHARRFGFRRTVPKEPWHWELVERSRPR